jgi:hypothetical protein
MHIYIQWNEISVKFHWVPVTHVFDIPNSSALVLKLPDIDQVPEIEIANGKPEVHYVSVKFKRLTHVVSQTRHN